MQITIHKKNCRHSTCDITSTMSTSIPLAVRAASGLHLSQGPPEFGEISDFPRVETKSCRAIKFSTNGQYFTYAYDQKLRVVRTTDWKEIATINATKTYFIAFSPLSTFFVTWEPYEVNKNKEAGTPNLNVYRSDTGASIKRFIYKPQSSWAPKWSNDEKVFAKISNNDLVFYDSANLDTIVHRTSGFKVASYSLSTCATNYYVLIHTLGSVGQPSLARLFQYPKFELAEALVCRSFFQADSVEYHWNANGAQCLLLTTTEQDKTEKSYYGKQTLHFVAVSGTSNMVTLSKEGPIYAVAWNPKGNEFAVVYGSTPAKASIFNSKCESVFELGTAPRNEIHFNPHGNLLLLAGFGNLRGNVEIWDTVKRKRVGSCDASDTTLLEWAPDGVHFVTATTSPRLRMCNGYKIWHYTGALVYETDIDELYEVAWQTYESNAFKEPVITGAKVEGIATKQVLPSSQAYRPPSARNRPAAVTFRLHDDDVDKLKEQQVSKNALKQRKKREARKTRKEEEEDETKSAKVASSVEVMLTGDADKDKKIKAIKKKLDAIEKLKVMQAEGKPLEINQVAKIKGEADLLDELQKLQM